MALPWLPDAVGTAVYARLHGLDDADRRDRPGERRWTPMTPATPLDVTIITGMSGAGRSEAAHVLEDLGFFVIDNLPPTLIGKVAELGRGARATRSATRSSSTCAPATSSHDLVGRARRAARAWAPRTRVLFLDAADDVLVRRYEESRRRHPLADTDRVCDGIAQRARAARRAEGRGRRRRRHVDAQRARAARPAARAVRRRRSAPATLQINIVSFGYKHGLRSTSTSCSTAGSCPNPHWVEELRPLDRHSTRRVRDYVLAQPETARVPRRARPPVRAAAARRTSARARRTCRSASAAPAAATAAS